MRRAKIVCTLGPARRHSREDPSPRRRRDGRGPAEPEPRLATPTTSGSTGWCARPPTQSGHGVGILADLQGPKIRLGTFADGPVDLERRASEFTITTRDVPGDASDLRDDVRRAARRRRARATRSSSTTARCACEVARGRRHRRAHPGDGRRARSATTRASTCPVSRSRVPALSEKDIEDLRWALHLTRRLHRAVVRALGRRRRATSARSWTRRACCLPVIAKIEKPQAIENIDEIVDAFDGVHGRPRRPRRGVPARGRAVPAEAGHRGGPAARQAGHRRHPDARVDDLRAAARPAPRPPTSPTPSSTAPTR